MKYMTYSHSEITELLRKKNIDFIVIPDIEIWRGRRLCDYIDADIPPN